MAAAWLRRPAFVWSVVWLVAAFGACAAFEGDGEVAPGNDGGVTEAAADVSTVEDGNVSSDASSDVDAGDGGRECPCAIVVGGFHREAGAPVTDDETFMARIASNGALESWRMIGRLPAKTYGLAAGADDTGRIHVFGGNIDGAHTDDVAWTTIPSGAATATWTAVPTPLARASSHGASATASGWAFVTGGFDVQPHAIVQSAALSGPSTVFTSTAPLPQARSRHAAAIGNGVLYVIAGTFDGNIIVDNVTYARLDGGAVAAWSDGGGLPTAVYGQGVYGSCAVFARGALFLIGGSLSGNFPNGYVTRSIVDPNTGMPGPWTPVGPLPKPRMFPACAVHDNRIYVFGGWDSNNTETADVHFATVAVDGSLSGWTATTPLPESRGEHAAVIVP